MGFIRFLYARLFRQKKKKKKIKVHYRFNQLLLENLVFNSVVFVCCPFYDKSIRSDEESEIK